MTRQRVLALTLLGLLLVLSAVLFFLGGAGEAPLDGAKKPLPDENFPPPPGAEMKAVVLYFPAEGDGLLHPEERSIISGPSTEKEALRLVEELIKGSRGGFVSPFPPEAQVRQVFITRDGTGVVDFSKELTDRHPSGSSAEMETVYCLVNSLTANFKSIKKVLILVNGSEKETLGGHLSLAEPFLPLTSLVAE